MTCPTHAADCPGHYHYEAGLPADLALSWVGPRDRLNVRTAVWQDGELVSTSGPHPDAGTRAALNAAKVEAGGGRPQRAMAGLSVGPFNLDGSPVHLGVDLLPGGHVVMATADGLVSWAELSSPPFPWEEARAEAATRQEVRDVVARWLPEPANSVGPITRDDLHAYIASVLDQAGWSSRDWELDVVARQEWSALAVAPVPELVPPPPVSGCSSRGAFLYEGASWELQVWPGYPQDEMLERLNLRWKYGHPPRTPDRARRAGVRP